MYSRKLALSLAKQYRTCPPEQVREDPSQAAEYERHLALCPYCSTEGGKEREAWTGLSRGLGPLIEGRAAWDRDMGIRPGQFRFVRGELSGWRDGLYYNPPMVMALEVARAVSDDVLVCQVYHDTALAGPGDLILKDHQTGMGQLFLESWNIYTLKEAHLGPCTGEVGQEIITALRVLEQDPGAYPDWAVLPRPLSEYDQRIYFRELEIEVGYVFASASVSELMDELKGKGLRLVYPSAKEVADAVKGLVPGTRWPGAPSTREEALALAELPPALLPLAARESGGETGNATLFVLRGGAITEIRPLDLEIHLRSGALTIGGRISGLPRGEGGSALICLLKREKDEPVFPTRLEWDEETGDFVVDFPAGKDPKGELGAAVLFEGGRD